LSIRAFQTYFPSIADAVYVDEDATVIGQVTIGEDSSVWPRTVLRGDVNYITIGKRCSIQDGTVIHVTHDGPYHPGGFPTVLGDDITIGHQVILHGCTIQSDCLIGMAATIMDGVIIESQVILGAGSLVPPGKVITSGYLWLGIPAKKTRPLTNKEIAEIQYNSAHYVRLKQQYQKFLPI